MIPFNVNSYSTAPFVTAGVAETTEVAGDSVLVATDGVVSGFTGLTPNSEYYVDGAFDGTVTTTDTFALVGKAISSTKIRLNFT